jgi:hypothetical protein
MRSILLAGATATGLMGLVYVTFDQDSSACDDREPHARPIVGQTAGFHTDKTSGPLFEKGHHVVALKRFGDGHLPNRSTL